MCYLRMDVCIPCAGVTKRPKVKDSKSFRVDVQGFDSLPPHYTIILICMYNSELFTAATEITEGTEITSGICYGLCVLCGKKLQKTDAD